MIWVKQVLLTVFVLFFRLGEKRWSFANNLAKGVLGMTLLEGALLIAASVCIGRFVGAPLLLPLSRPMFYLAILCLYGLNYYVFVGRGYGVDFERQFRTFDAGRRAVLIAGSIIVFTLTVAGARLVLPFAR